MQKHHFMMSYAFYNSSSIAYLVTGYNVVISNKLLHPIMHYQKNHEEIVSAEPGLDNAKAMLVDCIFLTPFLIKLNYSENDADKKFSCYLNLVRDWRIDNAHQAPTATENELDTAINVLEAVCLYVVAFGINRSDIEHIPSIANNDVLHDSYSMVAEPEKDE